MDDIIRRAIAQDEIAKRDFDDWQYQHRRRQQQRWEYEQRQAAHNVEQAVVRQWLRTSSNDVRTTDFLDERNDEVGSNTGTGNDEAWNRWAQGIARAEAVKAAAEMSNLLVEDLDKFNDALQERFDRRKAYFEKQDADLQAQIDALEERVAVLEAELGELRAEIGGNATRSTVVPLLTFKSKGGRDADAA
jgi:hypothetical protein